MPVVDHPMSMTGVFSTVILADYDPKSLHSKGFRCPTRGRRRAIRRRYAPLIPRRVMDGNAGPAREWAIATSSLSESMVSDLRTRQQSRC